MDEIEQEKEEKEEEKARISGILILNIALKTNLLVEETIQNRLNIKLCWGTPYMGPAHNKNNEHPKIMNSLCVTGLNQTSHKHNDPTIYQMITTRKRKTWMR